MFLNIIYMNFPKSNFVQNLYFKFETHTVLSSKTLRNINDTSTVGTFFLKKKTFSTLK